MPKFTPTKDQENQAPSSPVGSPLQTFKSPSAVLACPVKDISPASMQRLKSSLDKRASTSPSGISKRSSIDKRATQSSPSVRKLIKMVMKSTPSSEKKSESSFVQPKSPYVPRLDTTASLCTTSTTPKKRNIFSRKLFNRRRKSTAQTENDLTTDMRTDRSYLPSEYFETEDDDFTGKSYLDYSSGEEEGMDDLVDVYGIDTPTRFTPRKSRLTQDLSRKPSTPHLDSISRKDSKLHSFLKNRLPSFRLPEEAEHDVSSVIPVYDNSEMSLTDAIFKNYERSKQESITD